MSVVFDIIIFKLTNLRFYFGIIQVDLFIFLYIVAKHFVYFFVFSFFSVSRNRIEKINQHVHVESKEYVANDH